MATKKKKQNQNCKKSSKKKQEFVNEDDYRLRLQEGLYSTDYILTKIFRKDGPPLGAQFDSLPQNAFLTPNKGSGIFGHARQENQGATKRRKISVLATSH